MSYASQFAAAIAHACAAHNDHPNTPRDAVRLWDQRTPYVIHPIWCATTLLTETTLPETLRFPGALALLWHDTLEDTTLPLPPGTAPAVRTLVQEMTFSSLDAEFVQLWERSPTTRLLKLYDKTSQFLDGTWLAPVRWNQIVAHTQQLMEFVESTYGELNILRIARALVLPYEQRF